MVGWCCMCRAAGETGSHLLVHCTFAADLWSSVLRSFGVLWVFPESITVPLSGWYNYFGKQNSKVWNLVPLCLMWTIWQERNNRTFEDEEHSLPKLVELFYGLLFRLGSGLGSFSVKIYRCLCCFFKCFSYSCLASLYSSFLSACFMPLEGAFCLSLLNKISII